MHDIKFIRENPQEFDAGLARRGLGAASAKLIDLENERRKFESIEQNIKANQNTLAKRIGIAKAAKDEKLAQELLEEAKLDDSMAKGGADAALRKAKDLQTSLASLPNLPAPDVPEGADEAGNVEQKRWGTPPVFAFAPREHFDIGAPLGLDFESAQAVSGARFAYLRGQVARLNRALGQFMLDTHTQPEKDGKFGYTEVAPPLLVRDEAMFGTAQLPKFAEDLFATNITVGEEFLRKLLENSIESIREEHPEYSEALLQSVGEKTLSKINLVNKTSQISRRWLIPTAEVSLTNLIFDITPDEAELPLRFTALTPCFRSEAGAAGRDTRGLIRQHQFDKVELVSITTPEASEAEHERMTQAAEHILEALGLPYRRMLLCAGDMGFAARKTYDLEVWLPGQNAYREISSCSNCGDFQARRIALKSKNKGGRFRPAGQQKGTQFVHTLNGSGLAVGRTLVACLENYQNADGSVTVPPVLAPYMGGRELLEPAG